MNILRTSATPLKQVIKRANIQWAAPGNGAQKANVLAARQTIRGLKSSHVPGTNSRQSIAGPMTPHAGTETVRNSLLRSLRTEGAADVSTKNKARKNPSRAPVEFKISAPRKGGMAPVSIGALAYLKRKESAGEAPVQGGTPIQTSAHEPEYESNDVLRSALKKSEPLGNHGKAVGRVVRFDENPVIHEVESYKEDNKKMTITKAEVKAIRKMEAQVERDLEALSGIPALKIF